MKEKAAFKEKKRQDTASMKVWSKPSLVVLQSELTENVPGPNGDGTSSDS